MNTKEKETKIEYRIAEIKKLRHCENDYHNFGLTESDIKRSKFGLGISLGIEGENGFLSFKIKAHFLCPHQDKEIELFGLESLFKFQIKEFKKHFLKKSPDEFSIPDPLMLNLLNIAISGTRGMLAVLNTNPSYINYTLPLLNPVQILKSLQKSFQKK